mgnify:CR=1 FL=1
MTQIDRFLRHVDKTESCWEWMGTLEAIKTASVVLCPNCNGQRTVSRPPWVAGDVQEWNNTSLGPYSCPTCGAAGYVVSPALLALAERLVASVAELGAADAEHVADRLEIARLRSQQSAPDAERERLAVWLDGIAGVQVASEYSPSAEVPNVITYSDSVNASKAARLLRECWPAAAQGETP